MRETRHQAARRQQKAMSGLLSLTGRIMRAQEAQNMRAEAHYWNIRAAQQALELTELRKAYEGNRILLQDLAIEEKKGKLGMNAPSFIPAGYTTTPGPRDQKPAPQPGTIPPGAILIAPTGQWSVVYSDHNQTTVEGGGKKYTYNTPDILRDLRTGRIHLQPF